MKVENLQEIIRKHVAWLRGEEGGERADLRGADLRKADLREADLRKADLDFSCLPLWCGSFGMKVDDRIIWQILCHISMNTSECSEEVQKLTEEIATKYGNRFCGYRTDIKPLQ